MCKNVAFGIRIFSFDRTVDVSCRDELDQQSWLDALCSVWKNSRAGTANDPACDVFGELSTNLFATYFFSSSFHRFCGRCENRAPRHGQRYCRTATHRLSLVLRPQFAVFVPKIGKRWTACRVSGSFLSFFTREHDFSCKLLVQLTCISKFCLASSKLLLISVAGSALGPAGNLWLELDESVDFTQLRASLTSTR